MLAFTYIGAIIGAGFASGQEIRKYFVDYGFMGFFGMILVAFLFVILGKKIMEMGYTSGADSYERILGYAFTCKAKSVFDYIICFFFIATGSAMFSGCGAYLNQVYGLNTITGSAIMAVVTFLVIIMGLKMIMKFSTFIVPLLIVITSWIAISSFDGTRVKAVSVINEVSPKGILIVLFSSIIYVAYNVVMGISILPALGGMAKSKKEINFGSIVAGIIIGLFGGIIYFALLTNYDKIQGAEIPIASLTHPSQMVWYGISFMIAVLTTAVGTMYGVYTRVKFNLWKFALITLVAYLLSLVGFSTLVAKLYFVMGIFGIALISMLLYGYGKRKGRE